METKMCDECVSAAMEERDVARKALEEAISMLIDESIITPGSATLAHLQNALIFTSKLWWT